MDMFKAWKPFEIGWLVVSTLIILGLSLFWEDTLIGTISSITGIICVVLVAKGRISNFFFGTIQAVTYAYVAYGYGLYGESMLNLFFYLPMQFIALAFWLKHSKSSNKAVNGEQVYAKRLSKKQWSILVPVIFVAVIAYAFLLSSINAQQVRLDSAASKEFMRAFFF